MKWTCLVIYLHLCLVVVFAPSTLISKSAHCSNSQVACNNGDCIPLEWWCDWVEDCPNSEDEVSCLANDTISNCASSHMPCNDGQCIPRKWWCDGIKDCRNAEDEEECTDKEIGSNCSRSEVSCEGGTCIPRVWWCDGSNDCPNAEDETKCPDREHHQCRAEYYRCPNGGCIPKSWVCDKKIDCHGGADEKNCSRTEHRECKDGYFGCNNGMCIPKTWVCDGRYDCSDGEEEKNCTPKGSTTCKSGYFACNDRDCIPLTRQCNGLRDCESGEDEKNCTVSGCGKQKIQPDHLGIAGLIIGGTRAVPGEWPWQAAVYRDGRFTCGAAIIAKQWLVTAAHCLSEKYGTRSHLKIAPRRLKIRYGSIRRTDGNYRSIAEVYTHPNFIYYSPFPNDVGVIRLKKPLVFTNTLQPICLPKSSWSREDSKECYITGWGHIVTPSLSFGPPDYLHKTRMELRSLHSCRASGISFASHICAGGAAGMSTACKGDSGGPLSCRDSTGTWKLIGVVSAAEPGCPDYRPSIFARVPSYVQWINNIIKNNSHN